MTPDLLLRTARLLKRNALSSDACTAEGRDACCRSSWHVTCTISNPAFPQLARPLLCATSYLPWITFLVFDVHYLYPQTGVLVLILL